MNRSFVIKSVLLLFLLTALLFSFVSCDELASFFENTEESEGNLPEEPDVESGNFRVTSKGELSVIDLAAVPEQVTVPAEVEGRKVTVISKDAFKGCQTVVNVTIKDGIETIGESAFASCPSLVQVLIPNSVTVIEDLAFSDCSKLYNVVVPESVRSLPLGVFEQSIGAMLYNGSLSNAGACEQIYADDFNNKVIVGSNTTPVLVKFGAYWCGPCRTMNQILTEVAEHFYGAVSVYIVDINDEYEDNPDLMNELMATYEISSIPALFLFIDGEMVWKTAGLKEKDYLTGVIEEQLQKAGK